MGLAFVQPMSLLQGIAELSSDPQLTVLILRLHSAVIEGEVRGSGSRTSGYREWLTGCKFQPAAVYGVLVAMLWPCLDCKKFQLDE